MGIPNITAAQTESRGPANPLAPVHATLRGWNEGMWLTVFDRGGNYFGRTSDRGILQRFNDRMDFEYHIDALSYGFSPLETYAWYQRESGARFWAGSINHLELIQQGDFKAAVPLGETWAVDARFRYDRTLDADRSLVSVGFRHSMFANRGEAFVSGTIQPIKPEADLELGFSWLIDGGRVTAALGSLDTFSDFIFLDLGASIADTVLDYASHPFTGRVAVELPLGGVWRVEGYGLAMTPTRVAVRRDSDPQDGFEQEERFAYGGGLVEWSPTPRTALGGYATAARARLGRSPLPAGSQQDAFDLRERTWEAGLFGIHRVSHRFTLESWVARTWRREERLRPDTTVAPNVDYEDRAWSTRSTLSYRAQSGFRADLGLDIFAREIARLAEVPGVRHLGKDNSRIRFGVGWHAERRASFLVGLNVDLDDSTGWGGEDAVISIPFDGAYGRFTLYW